MTEAYRNEQLTAARNEVTNARSAYETAKTKKARRDAAEALEFWTNKTAFLSNVKI